MQKVLSWFYRVLILFKSSIYKPELNIGTGFQVIKYLFHSDKGLMTAHPFVSH